ncbi:MAG: hypothetical protein MOB07_17550 [Acidobacteria bacterium]|nr:hypothetical protein [Acidobacteriota bacterium]
MSNYKHGIITLVVIAIALYTAPVQGQVKAKRDRVKGTAKNESPQSQQREPKRESGASTPSPVTLVEPRGADYLSGEANVAVSGNQNPVIRLGLSPNGVTMIEFPLADRFFALHPGNSDLVTIDESPTKGTDHFLVVRAGSGFASPVNMANARRAPVTSIMAQMQSGLVVTFLFYPVQQLAEQAHRVVVTYDRDEVIAARRAAGLAVNLDRVEEGRPRTISMRISPQPPAAPDETASAPVRTSTAPKLMADTAEIDTAQPPVNRDHKSSDPARIASLALAEATKSPRSFKKWSDSVHGLSLSITSVREVDKSSQMVVIAARNTKNTDARILPGQPDIYLETLDGKSKPLQVEHVRKLAIETTAVGEVIPGGETRYYALVYEAQVLGARQRLRVVVGQTTSADEPSTANLTLSNR